MGAPLMRQLKIGYWPLTKSLDSAGDRRRLVFWAQARGHTLITDLSQKVDVIVASENADFNSSFFITDRTPVVFDLVDAYLSPLNPIDDLARGVAKKLSGQITGPVRPFSHHIRDFCRNAALVVCSSIEQEAVINKYNTKTQVILDSHDEIPFLDEAQRGIGESDVSRILWEGQPATIGGVMQISSVLTSLSVSNELQFDFVTDEKYFKVLNRYFRGDTLDLLKKNLKGISDLVNVVPWSPVNLVSYANKSTVSMIPINLSVPMQLLKPENRLLIMWRLGLPCLTSASPAYARVAANAGVSVVCESLEKWSEGFSRILGDAEFARNQILKGQNYLRENHNREILLQKWDLVFESVLD
jgi:hypothetical protein